MSRALAGLACAGALLICSPQLSNAGVPQRAADPGATPERALPAHIAGTAQQADRASNPWWAFWRSDSGHSRSRKHTKGGFPTEPSSTPQPVPSYTPSKSSEVPELDPSAAGGALMLLIGGSLVLLDRKRVSALR